MRAIREGKFPVRPPESCGCPFFCHAVSEPVGAGERVEAGAEIGRMLAEMGEGAPSLTKHPWECRYCGYKAVGWCAGVPFPGKDKEDK